MAKIRHLEPYGFNEQPQFDGLVNTVKANIENINEKNKEQDKKDVAQDENIKQAIDKSVVSLELLSTPTEGSNRTYAVKQGGNEIGKIEIPFSSLVKSTTYDAEKNLLIFTIDNDKDIKVNLTDLIEDADLVQRRIFDDFKNEVNSFSSNTTDSISELLQKLGSGFTGANSANTVTSVIERNEKVVASALNDLNDIKLDSSAYTPTDLSDYYKKEETSGKTDIDKALASKANASDLTTHISDNIKHITSDERTKWDNAKAALDTHTGDTTVHITADERTKWNGKLSNVQYNKTDKKIYFYSGATTEASVLNIDATDFIKDGMVSKVEIKDVENSDSCLVITFNADAKEEGKEDIVIPVSEVFNPANYYQKSETSGATELNTAFGLKANQSDLTAHTGNGTIHITSDDKTKWNNAADKSHTHANKDVLDKITTIDSELNGNSNNLVVNSAITKVIVENEKVVSSALNDLNDRKLDSSAYTQSDLSNYYKKGETSGKSEIDTALAAKSNTGHKHPSSDITDIVTAITESTSGSTSVPTVNAVMQKLNELNNKITQLQTTVQGYETRIAALEGNNSNNPSQG